MHTPPSRRPVVVKLLALLVVPMLLAAACGGDDDDGGGGGGGGNQAGGEGGGASTTEPEDEGEPQRGGTITYGVEADTSNPWTPQRSTCAISCYIVFNTVYDPLVLPDENGDPQPNLLESFEPNEDFTEWTLTPREGITFHDDTPFDAEAIRYNIQDQLDSALTQAALKSVEGVALNEDDPEHNITIEDLGVNEDAEGGETAQARITPDAGSYDFHCEYHPNQMTGTITVE